MKERKVHILSKVCSTNEHMFLCVLYVLEVQNVYVSSSEGKWLQTINNTTVHFSFGDQEFSL